MEAIQSLPFQTVKHVVATKDAQPGATDGAIVVLVTGYLKAVRFVFCTLELDGCC